MSRKGLTNWVNKLCRQDMPVVGEVIRELSTLAGSDDVEVHQLAEVILRDPNLTSHVLRIANSVHYNYSGYPINTVSRAIVLIGFKGMRAICISSLIIDNFLKKGPRERLLQMMARALHAAAQARKLMLLLEDSRAEEAFIAALLFHLGEMAFWASDYTPSAEETEALSHADPAARKEAMETYLGTSFKAITLELAKQWRLGETLEKSLYPGSSPDTTVTAVLLGERLSRAALRGWDSPEVRDVMEQMAAFVNKTAVETREIVQDTAEQAVDIARTYGTEAVSRLIPSKNQASPATLGEANEVAKAPVLSPGDPELQLKLLRELSLAATDIADVNTIMQMVIEGIHRGIGLPRVAVGFVKKDRLKAKYVLGENTEHWREKFAFDVGADNGNLFVAALQRGPTTWVRKSDIVAHPEWHPLLMTEVIGRHESFVGVLTLGNARVGYFYADAKGHELNEQQYEGFRHFVSQAQMNLMLLSQRRSR